MRIFIVLLVICCAVTGCNRPGVIEVDLSSTPVRFIVDHKGWPRPFWWPSVTEFAIADDKDDLVWQLEATTGAGELAHRLAFIYGRVAPGFRQVFPEGDRPPKPLERRRTYYIAAGGEDSIYRMAFSLPVDPIEIDARNRRAVGP